MNQVFRAIKNRRSVRDYDDTGIRRGDIELIIDAGVWAPSAMNKQPVRYVVLQKKELLEKLSKKVQELMKKNHPGHEFRDMKDPIFYSAPVLIILCASKDGRWTEVDSALAAQNMMLAAHSIEISSCYIGMACQLNDDEETLKELGIPDDHEIVAPLIFGNVSGEYPEHKPRNPPVIFNWFD